MKKCILLIAVFTFIFYFPVLSGNRAAHPLQPVDEYYWMIESNQNTRDFTIVRFYQADQDGQNKLIYEERLEGVYLDPSKEEVQKMLAKSLKMYTENRLVAMQMKGYSQFVVNSLYKKRKDY